MKCAFLGPVKTEKMGHFLRPPLYKEEKKKNVASKWQLQILQKNEILGNNEKYSPLPTCIPIW
jgi:hypothetical protein